jgi:ATP-dependent DNA helicase RecQ
VLYLHHDRLRPKNVHLDPERYAFLKDAGTARMQKMIDFVSQDEVCRSSYLLEYFGQTDSADCGTCDVCRNKPFTKASVESSFRDSLQKYINDDMSGSYTLDDLKSNFASQFQGSTSELTSILRDLIDRSLVPPPAI